MLSELLVSREREGEGRSFLREGGRTSPLEDRFSPYSIFTRDTIDDNVKEYWYPSNST